jgi:hypothetical protein
MQPRARTAKYGQPTAAGLRPATATAKGYGQQPQRGPASGKPTGSRAKDVPQNGAVQSSMQASNRCKPAATEARNPIMTLLIPMGIGREHRRSILGHSSASWAALLARLARRADRPHHEFDGNELRA